VLLLADIGGTQNVILGVGSHNPALIPLCTIYEAAGSVGPACVSVFRSPLASRAGRTQHAAGLGGGESDPDV
jgi:hypothetical protein